MPMYDFECECGVEFENIVRMNVETTICPECGKMAKKIFCKTPPKFELKYNPVTDTTDWDGNTTRYYDEYKKMKKEGKKPRIAQLDGDG